MDLNMAFSPEEISQGTQLVEAIIPLVKWMAGTVAAAWIAVRWTLRQGVMVGKEKQRYEDLQTAVEKINALDLESLIKTVAELKSSAPTFITRPQHDEMTKFCQGEIERMVNDKMHRAVIEWKDELSALNANICHIMGALNLRPVDQGQRRRRSDVEAGD
jgi:hypothetical protein